MNAQTSIYIDKDIKLKGDELQKNLSIKSFSKLVEWLIQQEYTKLEIYQKA